MVNERRPNAKRQAPEGLNENYARELMELHTVGVNGGYTQADVTQVARVLTGWTVDRPQFGGDFQFNENRHEPGIKKVMGAKIKEHGELEGRELLHMLAMRPATAEFISRQLAIRFVSDDPPQPLVDRMAKSYLASTGDIPSVLKTLFRSPEFWATSDSSAKVKTPLEYVVSAVRASDAEADGHAVVRLRSAGGLQVGRGRLGEHRRASRPHELCIVAGRKPIPGDHSRMGAGDGHERTRRQCTGNAGSADSANRRGAA
jgi:uncharacterized protein (DUF1800 family)